jgi:hypothetical protein
MTQDVNRYWEFVRKKYPDARFVRWFFDGELHFYPDGESELYDENLGSCYRDDNASLVVKTGDKWRD